MEIVGGIPTNGRLEDTTNVLSTLQFVNLVLELHIDPLQPGVLCLHLFNLFSECVNL